MSVEVKLPQFGMGMTEGTLTRWLKREGDHVQEGELIAEVEAAKSVVDVIASASGVLTKILVQPDTTVPVYSVLALIN